MTRPMMILAGFVAALCLCGGCVVTETTDLGQPWIRANSIDLKPGTSTTEGVIAAMGLPFKIIQGKQANTEIYLYLDVRKRSKTILIPPILPLYTRTRMSEHKGVVIVLLTKRIVTAILRPTEEDLKKGVPELNENAVPNLLDFLKK